MKVKITRPDGTIIEIEGTPADINAVALTLGLFHPLNLKVPEEPLKGFPGVHFDPHKFF